MPFLFFEIWVLICFLYAVKDTYSLNAIIGPIVTLWGFSSAMAKFYHYERSLNYTKQLQRFIFSFVLFFIVGYVSKRIFLDASTPPLVLFGVFFLVVLVTKAVAISLLFWCRRKLKIFQKNILVYDSKTGKQFVQDVKDLKRTGYNIVVVNKQLFEEKNATKLTETIQKNKISSIYVPFETAFKKSGAHILNFGWEKENDLYLVANYNSVAAVNKAQFFGLTQTIKYRVSPLDIKFKNALKRTFDLVFSVAVILMFMSWVVPLLALLICLDSKGPVFFIQKRPGRDGKIFPCIKFRSMTVNNNTEKVALRNDARTTSVGKYIRKTSMDELPQFFNVFFGHMSVVGPRPNLTSQNDHYTHIFDEYSKRMYAKPGITGLAQISGARGGIENDIEMKHRVKYDIFYIRNWTFALDIKIIIRTVLNVIKGEDKAY